IDELDRRIQNMQHMAQTLKALIHCCAGDALPDCPILHTLGQPLTELFRKSKTAGKEFILLNVNEGKNYIAKLISQSVSAEHENFA
ncbi:hypothetical protein MJN51_30930, partial [Salmonella enterica subsp. enterica serovar Kentucky]|nr:hypothetical protein [Salmonella enterica subsp. enterica serovar Kentucky]